MTGGLTNTEIMRPDLWADLPDALTDIIIQKILVDLPFLRHRSLCCVSKRWRDFLLSNEYLVYYQMGKCMIFNSRRDVWESISMRFCRRWKRRWLQNLQLVSAGGGLLTFAYRNNDHLLVCIPLTERYMCLAPSTEKPIHEENLGPSVIAFTAQVDSGLPQPISRPYFVVDIGIIVDSKPCKLTIRKLTMINGPILFSDSRTISDRDRCKFLCACPEEYWFILNGPMLPSEPRSIILGFFIRTEGSEVLIYELESKLFYFIRTEP